MNTFKSIARAALIVAALGTASVATAAEPVVAADKTAVSAPVQSRDGLNRRVRIHNNTGWTMLRFYASDSRVTSWEEDMLGRGTLAAGSSIMMNIDDGSGACLYDFKAEFTNGQVLTRFNVNVCQIADYYYTR
ncbi:MAG: hypothetical protein Q7U72_14970 [Brevundimonas sp.]|uniref:hypothetical protein n=1 Tax=Brevundimonas sp. TaxID=1871086 RepID=UPI002717985D|nr:hypothetical protein [Brevundimonas sp.]MDO9078734.1 hypothetical protein [Brevundimonas sp.]MDP3080216.1 hypothetical protein [Brevundimonas sp.]MDZ4059610.1 hypothetical protein [Brevundimonas sp.]